MHPHILLTLTRATILLGCLIFGSSAFAAPLSSLDLRSLSGQALDKSVTDGKVVLVVNVASKCGYTRQYDGLQALYSRYKSEGLVILGAPCNQFGGQEPGSADEIATFCKRNFGVTFPLLSKQHVNGAKRSKLYDHLVTSKAGGSRDVGWNFEKFLVSPTGEVLSRFRSGTAPSDPAFVKAIEKALAAAK